MDVGQHAARGDGDAAEELVQLLVVAHGERDVTRHDARLLVVTGRVARELEHLGSHVLEDGRQVDGCAGTDARGVAADLHVAVHTAHRELEAGLRRTGRRLLLGTTATTLDHD